MSKTWNMNAMLLLSRLFVLGVIKLMGLVKLSRRRFPGLSGAVPKTGNVEIVMLLLTRLFRGIELMRLIELPGQRFSLLLVLLAWSLCVLVRFSTHVDPRLDMSDDMQDRISWFSFFWDSNGIWINKWGEGKKLLGLVG